MKLYTWLSAPNPRRAKMFVKEKEIDIEVIEAGDPDNPGHLSDEYCKKYSHRRVPLLELENGNWIAEAAVICRYLENIYPERPLMGNTFEEMAAVEMWDRLTEWEGLMAVSEIFRNTHKLFIGRGLSGYDIDIPQIPDLAKRGEIRLASFFEKIDNQLLQNEFLTGDNFTFADITLFCSLEFSISRKLPIPNDCKNVQRWHKVVSQKESTKI
tara:strand:- start:866 stop:1501 length:636 start_codon:yes stop_codon:yes gene_type:complete